MIVEEILSEFREQFISDMDVNMVVIELLDKDIISDGVRESIVKADSPRHRSEILHEHLKRTCTEEAFRTVCSIIAFVRGNPKMSALGKDMQRSLESGVCVHVHMHAFFYSCHLYPPCTVFMYVQVSLVEEDTRSWPPSLVLPRMAVDSPNR